MRRSVLPCHHQCSGREILVIPATQIKSHLSKVKKTKRFISQEIYVTAAPVCSLQARVKIKILLLHQSKTISMNFKTFFFVR